jgi:hypothetical protein
MVTVTLVENLSIATACVPYLKPFLESLESGMIRSDDLRRRGQQSTTDYAYGSGIRKRVDVSVAFKSKDSKNTDVELSQISTLRTMTSVTSGDHNRRSSDRRDSQGSRAQMLPQSKAWVGENISPYATENLSQQNRM